MLENAGKVEFKNAVSTCHQIVGRVFDVKLRGGNWKLQVRVNWQIKSYLIGSNRPGY